MSMSGMGSRRDQAFFNRWAPTYDRSILQRVMFMPVHKGVLDAFGAASAGAPHDVLDVGCGTGLLLEAAARRWGEARLTGVDVSAAMIAEAQRKHDGNTRFSFKVGDASVLPLEPASFDVALSTMSFHHWRDQAAGICEIARVLRAGGLFVLADVDVPLLGLLRPLLRWTAHASIQEPRPIERLLKQADLTVVTRRRFRPLPFVQLFVARKQ
jgi:ubiquinone/menaquinone biosynthesis C-methylase UbiE